MRVWCMDEISVFLRTKWNTWHTSTYFTSYFSKRMDWECWNSPWWCCSNPKYHRTDAMWVQQPTTVAPDLLVQNKPVMGFKPVLYSIHKVYVLLVVCLERIWALWTPSCSLLTVILYTSSCLMLFSKRFCLANLLHAHYQAFQKIIVFHMVCFLSHSFPITFWCSLLSDFANATILLAKTPSVSKFVTKGCLKALQSFICRFLERCCNCCSWWYVHIYREKWWLLIPKANPVCTQRSPIG